MRSIFLVCVFVSWICVGVWGTICARQTDTHEYEYQLAICAITQNEARFLKEWIEFHRLQGVEYFLIWDNGSTDETFAILKPYADAGIVKYTYAPRHWGFPQVQCYDQCIKEMAGRSKWLLVIDTDEFCFAYKKTLNEFLNEFSDPLVGGVAFNWQMYGTSNVSEIEPPELMIQHLIMKAPKEHGENRHVKVCVRPEMVKTVINPHVFTYHKGAQTFSTTWKVVDSHETPEVEIERARINHYWCRDKKFFEEEKIQRRKFTANDDETLSRWREALYNSEKDDIMDQFVPSVQRSLCKAKHPGKV